jgi:hypothetical protein
MLRWLPCSLSPLTLNEVDSAAFSYPPSRSSSLGATIDAPCCTCLPKITLPCVSMREKDGGLWASRSSILYSDGPRRRTCWILTYSVSGRRTLNGTDLDIQAMQPMPTQIPVGAGPLDGLKIDAMVLPRV